MSRQFGQTRRRPAAAPTPDEHVELVERSIKGQTASHLLDFAQDVVVPDQENSIRKRIFAIIDSDEPLDPAIAVQSWIELRSAHKLVSRLRKLKAGGETANLALQDSPAKSD